MNGILVAMMVMNCTFDSSGSEAMCSIACASFYAAALLGDSGAWGLLIYGSCVGGALVTGVADGRAALREYLARILRWRVGLKWYAIALALPLLLGLLACAANLAAGATLPANPHWPPLSQAATAFFWPALFGIALAEEPGFRGFALPRLLGTRSALEAALIVGILHTLWHLPLFAQLLLDGYYLGLLCKAVLIAMLLHASEDWFAGDGAPFTLGPLYAGFSPAELLRQDVFEALAFLAAALLLVVLTGSELGRKISSPAH